MPPPLIYLAELTGPVIDPPTHSPCSATDSPHSSVPQLPQHYPCRWAVVGDWGLQVCATITPCSTIPCHWAVVGDWGLQVCATITPCSTIPCHWPLLVCHNYPRSTTLAMLPPLHMPQLPPLQHYSSSLAAGPELRAPAAGYEIFRCLVIFFRRVSAICILFFGAKKSFSRSPRSRI